MGMILEDATTNHYKETFNSLYEATSFLMEVEDLLLWMDDENPKNEEKFEEAIQLYHRARETVQQILSTIN